MSFREFDLRKAQQDFGLTIDTNQPLFFAVRPVPISDSLTHFWVQDRREQPDKVKHFFGRVVAPEGGIQVFTLGGKISELLEIDIWCQCCMELRQLRIIAALRSALAMQ